MEKLYSDDDLRNIIDNEGLGYAVQWYLSADRIEDKDTADLWREAKKALDNLSLHLGLDM